MIRSVTAIFFACLFLTGSTLLPLGDFSLIADLPGMFRTYTHVVQEEPDVLDFIGDYLLNGKELLGHNKHDAPVGAASGLQYQHQASSLLAVFTHLRFSAALIGTSPQKHPLCKTIFTTFHYFNELLKPPVG